MWECDGVVWFWDVGMYAVWCGGMMVWGVVVSYRLVVMVWYGDLLVWYCVGVWGCGMLCAV